MENTQNAKSNKIYLIGILLIAVEFLVYLSARKVFFADLLTNDRMVFVFFNHAITLGYLVTIIVVGIAKHKWRFLKLDKRLFITFITLAYISAHTLNEEIAIFSRYPLWLNILLISIFVALHLIDYIDKFPDTARILLFFVLGFSTITIFYFAIYLIPYSVIGIIGLLFFGLTLYLFTPAILLTVIIYQYFKIKRSKIENWVYLLGLALPIIFTIVFLVRWQSTAVEIDVVLTKANKKDLPAWVTLGQQLSTDDMTQKVLSSNLRYDNLKHFGNWFNTSRNTISEQATHDPQVIIAQLLFGTFPLDNETCLKMIEYQYDARHEVYRKLWSGRDLQTRQVISDIQVYPDYRLAYVEKTITIANNNSSEWSQQEALYTFQLPEGSVASSLSLWIDGKEAKSRLSTKAKADSAYTTIVGREMRDPALLHWQEGNTITVTVFPCTPKEERIFKIGLTIPLKYQNGEMELSNIAFKGPNYLWADEISTIEFIGNNELDIDLPSAFNKLDKNKYVYKGNYDEDKTIKMKAPGLSKKSFSFNGKSYSISETKPQNINFEAKNIYLDINKSWTKNEFNTIIDATKGKNVFVYADELKQIDENNKDILFDKLNHLNFSIFPLQVIKNSKNSLLISKSTKKSPNLGDFKHTAFANSLSNYLLNLEGKIKFSNIGEGLSPYLKSLNEFEVFDYWAGNAEELTAMLKKNTFQINKPDSDEVVINESKCKIKMIEQAFKSEAPDHLMRLFAYKKIMQKTGKNYFIADNAFQDSLVSIANEAYIVSPVSSLVVLETKEDYDRFDIPENKNSLENAIKNSSGSIPEPHEWALIILAVLIVSFLYLKKS